MLLTMLLLSLLLLLYCYSVVHVELIDFVVIIDVAVMLLPISLRSIINVAFIESDVAGVVHVVMMFAGV